MLLCRDDVCQTAGVVYKISCRVTPTCQWLLHWTIIMIGEATKRHSKLIPTSYLSNTQKPSTPNPTQMTTDTLSCTSSSTIQTQASMIIPTTFPPGCVVTENTTPPQTRGLVMHLHPEALSDLSFISKCLAVAQFQVTIEDSSTGQQLPALTQADPPPFNVQQ